MKKSVALNSLVDTVMASILRGYSELLEQGKRIALKSLLSSDFFSLDDFLMDFQSHPESMTLLSEIETFGLEHDLWLKHSSDNITCGLYLFSYGSHDRVFNILKNMLLDFALNDIMGRDVKEAVTVFEGDVINKLVSGVEDFGNGKTGIEKANSEAMRYFKGTAPIEWYINFSKVFNRHLVVTHKNNGSKARGSIPGINEYLEVRNDFSGMNHVLCWVEYANGQFLDWELLDKLELRNDLKELHYKCAAFGAAANDLFSFEKEVIEHGDDCNLVAVVGLNNPSQSFEWILHYTGNIVRDLLSESVKILQLIIEKTKAFDISERERKVLLSHFTGLKICLQASYLWQAETKRYKRKNSIWLETGNND